MNVSQTAEALNVSRSYVYTLIDAGLLTPLDRPTLRGQRFASSQVEELKRLPKADLAKALAKRRT